VINAWLDHYLQYILWTFGLFYGRQIYFIDIGIFCGNLVHFSKFWYIVPRKIWQPWLWEALANTRNGKLWPNRCLNVFYKNVFVHSVGTSSVNNNLMLLSQTGLPDFSWYTIPKPEKCTKWTKMVIKYPRCHYNIANSHEYITIFPAKCLLNLPKLEFLVWKNHLATLLPKGWEKVSFRSISGLTF
jgi:hypothetical protein